MYEEYWGFSEKPFENTPDPKFLYCSAQHEEALMRMLYASREQKGAVLLTGEVGSGKTLLSRVLIGKLNEESSKYSVSLVVNPAIPSLDLLKEIVYQLGCDVSKDDSKLDILHKLNEVLYRNLVEERHSIIIIDEAQAINDETTFEEMRLILNFHSNERFPLTLLLLGQPELKEKIKNIRQLEQRFSLRYHLQNLNFEETTGYIKHRCRVAQREGDVFTDTSCRLIYEFTDGIPRKINNICDLSLLIGFGKKADAVDESITQAVIEDMRQQS
ncbi:MAG: hypothetical protein A3I43_05235 [Omnitrophica WOR_2 bacterium RIFCSPLOWO2_02_FULL_50_19]|nr:MAG: hypothetical protein A3I43_05235 [Omnitrophica WOR_2 bacterium RIFCSPLOWO2_02_FULL_50_19]